jgi:TraR antiactivator
VSDEKLILRPLIGLMHGRDASEVERFTIEEIEKHRQLRDTASRLEELVEKHANSKSTCEVKRSYVSAMIAVHAQQTVVSTLIDILGYIPEVPVRAAN